MKKKYMIIIASFLLMVFLSACSEAIGPLDEYYLESVFLNEKEIPLTDVSPGGAAISFGSNGKGFLTIGNNKCEILWTQDESTERKITVFINELEATGTVENDAVSLAMQDTGLTMVFCKEGIAGNNTAPESILTPLQKQWNGNWEGVIRFSSATGEWTDIEQELMSVSGTVAVDEKGNGAILLYSRAFSEIVPVIALNFEVSEVQARQISGFFMDFPCREGDVKIERKSIDEDSLFTTEFIRPEEYDWYVPEMNAVTEDEEEKMAEVIELSGECRSKDGGFEFKLELSNLKEE